jgi:hypothetical protein
VDNLLSFVTLAVLAWLTIRVESHHTLLVWIVKRLGEGDTASEQNPEIDGSEQSDERKVAARGTR